MTSVSFEARVVAAGPSTTADKLCLTISLLPAMLAGTTIDMAEWPDWPTRWKDKLKLYCTPVTLSPEQRPAAPSSRDANFEHALELPNTEKEASSVLLLWQQVAEAALRGDGTKVTPEMREQFWDAMAKVFTEPVARTYVDAAARPAVLATGRGDAAILHLLWQAERLAERVASRKSPSTAKVDVELPVVDLSKIDRKKIEIQSGDPQTKIDAKEDFEKLLEAENEAIDKKAQALLGQNVGALDDLARWIDPNTQFTKPDEKNGFPNYKPLAGSSSLTSFPLKDIFGERAKPLEQTQIKHLASQLPDSVTTKVRPKGTLSEGKARDLEDKDVRAPIGEGLDFLARTLVSAIRSSPVLSRLFRFVIDVEVDAKVIGAPPVADAKDGEDHPYAYFFLAAGTADAQGQLDPKQLMFSIASATWEKNDHGLTGFWPATREEIDLRCQKKSLKQIRQTGVVSQIGGVVDLGMKVGELGDDTYNPRFDIVSIDPIHAMEASVRNSRRRATFADSMKRAGLVSDKHASKVEGEHEPGIVTRGLSIVDRWRAESVAGEILTSTLRGNAAGLPNGLRLIDGDDLTIGYRIDVAVRMGEGNEAEWRSLMERDIDYSRPGREAGKDPDLERWFREVAGTLGKSSTRRRTYDAGTNLPSARRRRRDPEAGKDREMIHAEEIIAAWEGDPLGLNCGRDMITVRPGSDVAISRSFDLPGERAPDARKSWPLRYGWAYRFGVRPVWLGGVSLSPEDAQKRYTNSNDGYDNLTLPGTPTVDVPVVGWRRFLRHEPIHPPVALLPEKVALEPVILAPQSGVRATLRSLGVAGVDAESQRFLRQYKERESEWTWRVILPPRISLDEAVRHGVFDGKPAGKVALGGLLQVDYDQPTGARAQGKTGSAEQTGQKKGFPAVPLEAPPGVLGTEGRETVFEDVFRIHSRPRTAQDRKEASDQYHVDPMADFLVIAIRPNSQTAGYGYFPGKPKLFPIRDPDDTILPVALRLEKDQGDPRTKPPTQDDFWNGEPVPTYISGTTLGLGAGQGGLKAKTATLRLRKGESVELDCWFIPSVEKLRAYCAWPEVLAVKAAHKIGKPAGDRKKYRDALLAELQAQLGAVAAIPADLAGTLQGQPAWVGMGGVVADPVAIAAASETLHRRLTLQPLPELAAVRTIDVVHAVARPPRPPAFVANEPFMVLRSKSDDASRRKRLDEINQKGWPKNVPAAVERYGSKGDDGILFVGALNTDRDTCRQIEVRAFSTVPGRPLDDIALGRTELQQLLGEWPARVVPEEKKKSLRLSQSARHLFGFDVDAKGRVYLPKSFSTLLSIDDLAERAQDSNFSGLERVDLVLEQIESMKRRNENDLTDLSRGAIRVQPLDTWSDRLARRATFVIRATSRFDPYFLRLTPTDQSPLPERLFPPNPDQVRFITRQSLEVGSDAADTGLVPDLDPPWPHTGGTRMEQAAALQTTLRHLWITATIAPAKPQVHAVLPSYNIVRGDPQGSIEGSWPSNTSSESDPDPQVKTTATVRRWEFQRLPRLRIMLDRPWFSSGEGERLGIVLWPPRIKEISDPNSDNLNSGKVPRRVLHSYQSRANDVMDLVAFDDDDLGAGGKFTTRWGADPIRANSGPKGPFLPPEAILEDRLLGDPLRPMKPVPELLEAIEDEDCLYVPSIDVPLKDLRENSQNDKLEAVYETLTAALVTYVPKFDVETEKWFVDLVLNADRVHEPFVRLGLVRYQPAAEPGLRVSAPAVSWAQVLPGRTVTAWTSSDAARNVVLKVQVSGTRSGRASTDSGKADELVYPRVKMTVIERKRSASGLIDERVLTALDKSDTPMPAIAWADWSAPDGSGPLDSPRVLAKTFRLSGIAEAASGLPKRELSVLIEEADDFLSTADQNESPPQPVSPKAQPASATKSSVLQLPVRPPIMDVQAIAGDEVAVGIVRSGPRFLARLDVKI